MNLCYSLPTGLRICSYIWWFPEIGYHSIIHISRWIFFIINFRFPSSYGGTPMTSWKPPYNLPCFTRDSPFQSPFVRPVQRWRSWLLTMPNARFQGLQVSGDLRWPEPSMGAFHGHGATQLMVGWLQSTEESHVIGSIFVGIYPYDETEISRCWILLKV